MGIFGRKYFYLSTKKADGSPVLYGALRNRGKDGKLGTGSFCSNESEAIKASNDLLRGRLYELKTSKHSVLSEATKEWKANKLTTTGDLEGPTQRLSHKLEEKEEGYPEELTQDNEI